MKSGASGSPRLRATRLVGNEKWQAEVLLNETGVAIGYTKTLKERSPRRVKLGYAMGCVKGDDSTIEY